MRTKLMALAAAVAVAFGAWAANQTVTEVTVEQRHPSNEFADISGEVSAEVSPGMIQLWEGGPYWADRNVGADKPEDYGLYFWWGDTTGHRQSSGVPTVFNGDISPDDPAIYTYGKSVFELQSVGWLTSGCALAPSHDAAHVKWGGDWRMPTYQELSDLNNKCDWTWGKMNGVNGYIVRGRGAYASNSIFLPAAGYDDGAAQYNDGSGSYWSSVPFSDNSYYAYELYFYSGGHYMHGDGRHLPQPVRPVQGFISGPIAYAIYFDANGGSVSPASRTTTTGTTVGALPTPTRSGYTFAGWYTAANGGTQVTASTKVTGNVTYYAHWTANSSGGGGSGSGSGSTGGVGNDSVSGSLGGDEFNWYDSTPSNKREATYVRVGDEYWSSSDKDKPLPHRFACGAVLNATVNGKRLDLNNVVIAKGGIHSDGDLAILLTGDNFVSGSIFAGWPTLYSSILQIFGPGTLIVSFDGLDPSILGSDVSIVAGASVTVNHGHDGYTAIRASNRLLVSMSSVVVHSNGLGLSGAVVNVFGSVVAVKCSSSLAGYRGTVVIDSSVVNFLMTGGGNDYLSLFLCKRSYFSCVRDVGYALSADEASFDNSIAKLYSKTDSALAVDDVSFDEGDYYVASGSSFRALDAYHVGVNGGNVQVCASRAEDAAVGGVSFEISSGRMEIVDKVDVRELLKYDAAAAAAITGGLAVGGGDVATHMASFYSDVILDAVSNDIIADLKGVPYFGISCLSYTQHCGTVWCNLANFGVRAQDSVPIVNGGSYKGQFFGNEGSWVDDQWMYKVKNPAADIGGKITELKCITYSVAGAKKYDKITRSWGGLLPSYYGTGSLYTDAAGKLYFWLPSCNLTLKPSSTKHGTVSGGGTYKFGAKATIKAKAKSGYVFAGWFADKACKKPLNPNGYDNRKPTVKYTMPAKNTTVYAKFVTKAAAKKSLKFSSATKKLAKTAKKATAGKAFSLALGISSVSLPTVTAKGLPKGLKIDKTTGKITGVGTVPGSYTATITVKDAAGNKITQKVKITVETAAFAKGAFYGTALPDGKTSSYLRFSVGKTGKVTGKVKHGSKWHSFSSSLASCTASKATFSPKVKIGSKTFKPGTVTVKTRKVGGLSLVEAANSKGTFAAQKKPNLVNKGKALAKLVGWTFPEFTRNTPDSGLTKKKDRLTVVLANGDAVKVTGVVNGKKLTALSWVTLVSGMTTSGGITTYTLYADIISASPKYERTLVITATVGPSGVNATAAFAK